jgi:hypothetical protein
VNAARLFGWVLAGATLVAVYAVLLWAMVVA